MREEVEPYGQTMIELAASRVGTHADRLDQAVAGVQARCAPYFPGGEVQDTGHAIWTMSTTPLVFANGVIRYDARDFSGFRSEVELDNCLAALSTFEVPWRFSVWDHLGAEVLVPRLLARGMTEAGADQAMWLALPGAVRNSADEVGIEIRRASDPCVQRAWAWIFTTVFGIPGEYTDLFEQLAAKPPSRSFVAFVGSFPIGCLSLAIEDGLAVVSNLGVVPSARGHGVARCLLQAAHALAVERGISASVAVVPPAGSDAFTRLGYHPVTRVTYLIPPPPPAR